MRGDSYRRIQVTNDFVNKVLKPYTEKVYAKESKKNGVRKEPVTKKKVCKIIIDEMQNAGLI